MSRTLAGTEFDTAFRSMAARSVDPAQESMRLSAFSDMLEGVISEAILSGLSNVAITALLDRVVNNLPSEDVPADEAIAQLNEALKKG